MSWERSKKKNVEKKKECLLGLEKNETSGEHEGTRNQLKVQIIDTWDLRPLYAPLKKERKHTTARN